MNNGKSENIEHANDFNASKIMGVLSSHAWSMSFLPIVLVIGTLAQLGVLARYGAWYCFDWSQVPNDTAILFVPVLSTAIGWIVLAFLKVASSKSRIVGLSVSLFVSFLIIAPLYFWLDISIFLSFTVGICFFVGGAFSFKIGPDQESINAYLNTLDINHETMAKFFPSLVVFAIYAGLIITTLTSSLFFDQIYQKNIVIDSSVSANADTEGYQLRYLNSKCVVYGSGLVRERSNKDLEVNFKSSDFEVDLSKLSDGKFSK